MSAAGYYACEEFFRNQLMDAEAEIDSLKRELKERTAITEELLKEADELRAVVAKLTGGSNVENQT